MRDEDRTRDLSPTFVDHERTEAVELDDAPLASDEDRYASIAVLGKGGMGEIRLCKDSRIARQVAVKALRTELRDDAACRARFLREARLQGQLEHPSIVPVHDVGVNAAGDLYFTMKRVRGVTLREALKAIERGDLTRFSRRRLLTAFSSICLAVDFAHSRGVVHRDLKPANIMLGDFGEVYVLDWGIAKVMDRDETPLVETVDVSDSDTPTRTGHVLGTPRYMAPEQKRGEADPRSDVYSLGLMLGEIVACEPEPPPELATAATRATQQDPALRFTTARELHEAIERFLDGDRDVEVRRRLADEHARRAEHALERAQVEPTHEARIEVARDVGRALGMEPGNQRALRALAKLLGRVPDELPPGAQAELDRHWNERGLRMIRSGILAMVPLLMLVPVIAWMGVRDWSLLIAYTACIVGAFGFHRLAGDQLYVWQRGAMFVLTMAALLVLSMSMGVLGVLPAALVIVTMAYRINVVSARLGLAIFIVALITLLAPFVLDWLEVVDPAYVFRDGAVTVLPRLHDLPAAATQLYLIVTCFGAIMIAQLYSRQYVRELRRADARAVFHAWQLEQLVPPDPS